MPMDSPKQARIRSLLRYTVTFGAAFVVVLSSVGQAEAGFKFVPAPADTNIQSSDSGTSAQPSASQVLTPPSNIEPPVVIESAGTAPPTSSPGVPSPQASAPSASAMPESVPESGPVGDSAPTSLAPPGVSASPDVAASGPPSSAPSSGDVTSAPIAAAPVAPPVQVFATAPVAAPSTSGAEIVEGFGNNVPLTVALQQVLPQGYSFTLAQGVDKATTVNWIGGRPWPDVLQTMLKGANLSSQIGDHQVSISQSAGLNAELSEAPVSTSGAPEVQNAAAPQMLMPPPGMEQNQTLSGGGSQVPSSPSTETSWDASAGESLHQVLGEWCKLSHTDLQWETEYDYPVEAGFHASGTFESAVRQLLRGFANADPQPVGVLHRNADVGHPILLIRIRGNNYGD